MATLRKHDTAIDTGHGNSIKVIDVRLQNLWSEHFALALSLAVLITLFLVVRALQVSNSALKLLTLRALFRA